MPIGRLVGGRWDTVIVVTKAGGFGTPTTLLAVGGVNVVWSLPARRDVAPSRTYIAGEGCTRCGALRRSRPSTDARGIPNWARQATGWHA